MPLQKIARQTLSEAVFEQLTAEIVHGHMRPGASLPAERDLVARLGVNRGAVREGLKRLAQAGLVKIHQGGGTRVLDYRRTAGLDLLERLLIGGDGSIDLRVARGVLELRAVLAPDVARLSALRAAPGQVRELDAVVARMSQAADDLPRLQMLALSFWEQLVRSADNVAYELAFNSLKETYERLREALVSVMADEFRDVAAYGAITDAVRDRDEARAERLARDLIARGTRRVAVLIAMLEHGAERRPQPEGVS